MSELGILLLLEKNTTLPKWPTVAHWSFSVCIPFVLLICLTSQRHFWTKQKKLTTGRTWTWASSWFIKFNELRSHLWLYGRLLRLDFGAAHSEYRDCRCMHMLLLFVHYDKGRLAGDIIIGLQRSANTNYQLTSFTSCWHALLLHLQCQLTCWHALLAADMRYFCSCWHAFHL